MASDVTTLTGFREDTLDLGFEEPARMTFTLEGVRSDATPLDTDAEWQYKVNGVVLIKGFLRVLEEKLSPSEDYQRYTLTDRWQDITREALLIDDQARITFNSDNSISGGTGPEDELGKLIELIAEQSSILTGSPKVVWPGSAPDDLVERNIEAEGRGIGEFVVELLRYNPNYRLYYNSNTGQLQFKDISAPTAKTVKLNLIHSSWMNRAGAPPFSDVCEIDLSSDKADCYEKVRLEGYGEYIEVLNDLVPIWNCDKSPPYFPQDFIDNECMRDDFARKFRLPDNSIPADVSFDDEGRLSPGQSIRLEAYIPKRNTGQCVAQADDPSVPEGNERACVERWESGSGNEWQWTDFRWVSVGEVDVPIPDGDGNYIIRTQDRMLSTLNVWSPNAADFNVGGGPMLPSDPRILPWNLRARYWERVGGLVSLKDGGCPNGTSYQRVNTDWVKIYKDDGEGGTTVVRDDSVQMQTMRDRLFDQVSRPKTSGSVTIYLHLVTPTATLEGDIRTSPTGAVNLGNVGAIWELGDALNVLYDPSETLGPGVLPDYVSPGVNATWANMNIIVMGIHFDRRGQTLKLDVANTPFIFGDRLSEGLQR